MSLLGGANSMGPTGTVGNATDPTAGNVWSQAPGVGTTTMPPLDKPTASGEPLINRPIAASGITAPPQLTLATDPTYLSYQRTLGYNEATARANAQANSEAIARQLAVALPAYQQQMQDRIQNMDNNYEGRGLFRSGFRLAQDAKIQRDVGGQIAAAQANAAEKTAAVQRGLDQQLGGYAIAQANQQAAANARITQQNAYNDALYKWAQQNPSLATAGGPLQYQL